MNFDKKIKDELDQMGAEDLSVAEKYRSDVWSNLAINKKVKRSPLRYWPWLLLLLSIGAVVFLMLRKSGSENGYESDVENENIQMMAAQILKLESQLAEVSDSYQRSISELGNLKIELQRTSSAARPNVQIKESIRMVDREVFINDTIYITSVDVQYRDVEKIIRDTIYLTPPHEDQMEAPVALKSKTAEKGKVQFNFSATTAGSK